MNDLLLDITANSFMKQNLYLERQACTEHEHENEFEVLIYGPQGFNSSFSITNKEI